MFLFFLLGLATSALFFTALRWVSNRADTPAASSAVIPAPLKSLALSTKTANAAALTSSLETEAFRALFSKAPDAQSTVYTVKSGDNFTLIAKKHGVTIDLIKKVNGLESDRLVPDMKLKIPTQRFSLVVDKSQNTLLLKGDEEILKTYVVSTGTNNSTPVGVFKITDKIINPTWYKAGAVVPPGAAENELGARWLGISQKGYGIHGTIRPEQLGQQATAGCVRMSNSEVEELYAIVPSGTEVTILD